MKRPVFAIATHYTEGEIEKAIDAVRKELPDKIERILYTIGDDWADEPALFFRVLLKDPDFRSVPRQEKLRSPEWE
jgi:hypothetical protein